MLRQQKTSEVFQFKVPVGTKDGNFVPFLLSSLILGIGLTYNNEISSVRLGREPNFFMHLFTLAFQWFATSHTWKISCFSPRIIQGIARTYQFITVWWKFMCEQLPLFTEMKYLASRQNWNLQPLKVPDTNS